MFTIDKRKIPKDLRKFYRLFFSAKGYIPPKFLEKSDLLRLKFGKYGNLDNLGQSKIKAFMIIILAFKVIIPKIILEEYRSNI